MTHNIYGDPDGLELTGAARAGRLRLRPAILSLRHRPLGRLDRVAGAQGDSAGHGGVFGAPGAALRGPLAGLPLGVRGRGQRVGPAADRAQPFLRGADLKPGLHLGVPGRRAPPGQVLGVGLVLRRVIQIRSGFGLGQFGLKLLQLGQVLLGGQPGRGDGGLDPARLVLGGPGRTRQPAQPTGDLGRRGVSFVPASQGLGHRLPGGFLGFRGRRQVLRRRLAGPLGRGQPGGRLVRRRPQLEQALLPCAAAPGPVRPEQVTGPGHRLQDGIIPNDPASLLQVFDHNDPVQQLGGGLGQLGGHPHQVAGRRDARGCRRRCDWSGRSGRADG